jgi:hypothetical protein
MQDAIAMATADVLERTPMPAPVRPRHPTTPAEVHRMADALWGQHGPAHPAGARTFLRRELPHVYVPSVMQESHIFRLLDDTITNGDPLFIHGLVPGVGAKMLVMNYARAFNARAQAHHDARRIAVLKIDSRAQTIIQLLDSFAIQLKIPLSSTEVRRSATYLVHRLLEAVARQNIAAICIARLSHAHPVVRGVIADLLYASDPAYHVDLEPHPLQCAARRVGFVFVDTQPPEDVFSTQPDVLLMLRSRYAAVRPFRTHAELAEVLRRSDIGLEDLDINSPDDHDMVVCLAEQTGGLLAQIHPFLGLVDSIAVASGGIRPTAAVFHAALPFYRRMVEMRSVAADVHGASRYVVRARPQTARSATSVASGPQGAARQSGGRMSDSARTIAKRKDSTEHARRETRAALRKQHTAMAGDHAYDATQSEAFQSQARAGDDV